MSQGTTRNTVTVRIGGEEHVLRSTAEPEYAKRCAALLDGRIQQVRRAGAVVEPHRAVLLAALSLSDECFRSQEELEQIRKEVSARANKLARKVEDALGGA